MSTLPPNSEEFGHAITIRGARQHNLKSVDVAIPKGKLTVVSGVSGSGKSSLAFNTLYAEGQRAYVESLSTYARQFLERLEKPDVDLIDGIQPAIAIRQRNTVRSSRSTVGTSTEVYDYLRLLFARLGRIQCHRCGARVEPDSPDLAIAKVKGRWAKGDRLLVTFPAAPTETLPFEELASRLVAQGYLRAWWQDSVRSLEESWSEQPAAEDSIQVVADRLVLQDDESLRLAEAVEAALHAGEGICSVRGADDDQELALSERYECPQCDEAFERPTPQLFSFNSPQGACEACNGFGERLEFDEQRIVPDLDRPLNQGAIKPWSTDAFAEEMRHLVKTCKEQSIPLDTPFRKLSARHKTYVLENDDAQFQGVIPWLREMRRAASKEGHRFFTRRYMGRTRCRTCDGSRLRAAARAVRVRDREIGELCHLDLPDVLTWLQDLELTEAERTMAGEVLEELRVRVRFLLAIGLGYLTLDRASRTLSGGEMQRIHLSNSLGGRLVETLYVLDEPSIGLHPRDTHRLIDSLKELAELGNTVVVVEHDLDVLRVADRLIDLGPGAGADGGMVLYEGPPPQPGDDDTGMDASISCAYLLGRRDVGRRAQRRSPGRRRIKLVNARRHNLKGIDVVVPLGMFVCVTGVSGSGKSTLINEILHPALAGQASGGRGRSFDYDALHGSENVSETLLVDQSPIGRSARSNPATYLQVFGEIRELLASTTEARKRGFSAGRFSFNVAGGRCPECQGMGQLTVEMQFMADITVQCEECHGQRFEPNTLEVAYRGLNVAQILDLTVDEAIQFFSDTPAVGSKLWLLQRVGLGYLRLGQAASTLSGGESQRIKIARELMGSRKGHRLYLLDEPTTGLHAEDIRKLLRVLNDLVEEGHSVLVIEHNLDVIKNADHVIDLGPGGGPHGGRVVVAGPPESLVENELSITGQHLAPHLSVSAEEAQ